MESEPQETQPARATSEWIVRFGKECLSSISSPGSVAPLLFAPGKVKFQVLRGLGLPGEVLVSATATADEAAIEQALRANSNVASFSRNAEVRATDLPNDPLFNQLVGLNNTGQLPNSGPEYPDINAPEVWEEQKGSKNVVVAVMDSGIDVSHPDLMENLWTNEIEESGIAGVDDDGNGCVDDVHGCSFLNLVLVDDKGDQDPKNDVYLPGGNVTDKSGHGTHVAGTIGAVGGNREGVVGVAQTVSLMALQVLDANNVGSTANVIAAAHYAKYMAAQMNVSGGAERLRVINASLGTYTPDDGLYAEIRQAGDAGILLIAAAGNGVDGVNGVDTDRTPFYPASFDLNNVISVAAVDNYDRLAPFSNFGRLSVDIAAPGVNVLSTRPGGAYGTSMGTSMAAPLVSGVATLLWSEFPEATVAEVRAAILRSGDSLAELQEKTTSGKRLNAAAALQIDVAAPFVEMTHATAVMDANTPAIIQVRVADNHDLDESNLGKSSLAVKRLGTNDTLTAECLEVFHVPETHEYELTFRLYPPDGRTQWGARDFGVYRVTLPDQNIFDIAGNAAESKVLGTFDIAVDEPFVIRVSSATEPAPLNKKSLRQAIQEANAKSKPTQPITILLPDLTPGTQDDATVFRLNSQRTGDDTDETGDLDVRGNIILEGVGFSKSIIDAQSLDRVIDVHPGAKLTVRSVTLRGGKTITVLDDEGGGIRNEGTLTLDDVVIRDNEGNRGGGLFNSQFSTATVHNSTFLNNVARTLGGAVFNVSEVFAKKPELETLLAIGGEQLVNTTTTAPQDYPAVAIDENGVAIVVWQSFDGADAGKILAQRFNRAGERLGGQVQVSASTTQRLYPTVAVDKDGRALIAWQGALADGDGWGILARHMDPLGNLEPLETIPYQYNEGNQLAPQVAMGRNGEELIVWDGAGASDERGIYAVFRAPGAGRTISLRANTAVEGNQSGGLATIARDGSALIVWTTETEDGSWSILGRRLNTVGIPLGPDFVIATTADKSLRATSVIATRDGYVVAWQETVSDSTASRLFFRRLSASGTAVGPARLLSDGSVVEERGAALAALPDGGFLATYTSLGRDGSGWGVAVRQFDAAGLPRSAVLPVNTTTVGAQLNPRVAANLSGLIAIVWNGAGPGDRDGIVMRRFETSFNEASVVASATLKLENITLSANKALFDGGAVYNSPDAVTWLNHVTVHRNTVEPTGGGAISGAPDGTLAMKAVLAAGNFSAGILADLRGELTSLGYNLVSSPAGASGFGRGTDLVDRNAGSWLAPLPDPIADPDAPLVHQLFPGSLAIDHGDPAQSPLSDQIGSPRPVDGDGDGVSAPDIGAVERYFAEVSGTRYYDKNGNGLLDDGDTALAGLTVFLDTHNFGVLDSDEQVTSTNSQGRYFFRNVKPGRFQVVAKEQTGWRSTLPPLVPAGEPSLLPPATTIDHLAVDVDFDGDVDLVALERDPLPDADRMLVYLNDGMGTFAEPIFVSTGVSFAAGVLAQRDIDADGLVDFVVAESSNTGKLNWIRNLDNGAFAAAATIVPQAKMPSAPVLALLNGDALPDLAWLERNDSQSVLHVALNLGGGEFAEQQAPIGLPSVFESIVVGDVNSDGRNDLMVGEYWVPNLSSGLFGAWREVELQNFAAPRQMLDLDADGDLDLIAMQATARTLNVLRNSGSGRFDLEPAIPLAGVPAAVTLADLDRDGDQDVLVTLDNGTMTPFFNDKGKLRQGPPATELHFVAGQILSVQVADLDRDGADDLSAIVQGEEPGASRIAVFRNTGGAQRRDVQPGDALTNLDFGEQAFRSEISGYVFNDVDNDRFFDPGLDDLLPDRGVTLSYVVDGISTLYRFAKTQSDGRYTFADIDPFREYIVKPDPVTDWVQSSPRDGRYEVTVSADGAVTSLNFGFHQNVNTGQEEASSIHGTVYLDANGNGQFDPDHGDESLANKTVYLDMDLSGTPTTNDVYNVTDGEGRYQFNGLSSGVRVVRAVVDTRQTTTNPLGNAFVTSSVKLHETASDAAPQSVALIDFDGDGDLDAALPNGASNNVAMLLNNNGVFVEVAAIAAPAGSAIGPVSITVGQFDGVNGLDIAVANLYTKNVSVFLSTPDHWFRFGENYGAGNDPTALVAGNFFGSDGRYQDLAIVNEREGTVHVLKNRGNGTFSGRPEYVFSVGDHPRAIAAADLDGDGHVDLAVTNFDSDNVSLLWKAGDTFSAATNIPVGDGPGSIAIADVNNDGRPDVIVGNYRDGTVTILSNAGNHNFSKDATLTLPLSPTSLAPVDIDQDGDLDIVAGTRTKDAKTLGVSLLRNRTKNMAVDFSPEEGINLGAGDFPVSRHLSVAAGDLNRDGRADIVVGDGVDNKAHILTNGPAAGSHRVLLTGAANPDAPAYNFGVKSTFNAPTIDRISDQTLDEDAVSTVALTGVSAGAGEADQPLKIEAFSDNLSLLGNPEVLTDAPQGPRLTLAPLKDQHGQATITVRVTDGGADKNLATPADNGVTTTTFVVTVTPVNDPPVLTLSAAKIVRTEDSLASAQELFASVSDDDVPLGATPGPVTYLVEGFNPDLFEQAPAIAPDGKLTFTPAKDAFGETTVTVRARNNDGGEGMSAPRDFTIAIESINDPPTFTPGPPALVLQNSGEIVLTQWATNINVGPANERQSPTFQYFTTNEAAFEGGKGVGYSVDNEGTVRFRLKQGVRFAQLFILLDDGEDVTELRNLRITAVIAGDANLDNKVDLEDLNLVRERLGSTGTPSTGDTYPFNGIVDLDDLNAVRNNFGAAPTLAEAMVSKVGRASTRPTSLASDVVFQALGEGGESMLPPGKRAARRWSAR